MNDTDALNVDHVGTATVAPRQAVDPSISAIICTRDRPRTIGRAVESIAKQMYSDFEVLVVDQSRSEETQRIVSDLMTRYPCVRYLHLDEFGRSRACNAGIRNTTGEVIAFTDDDCEACETWLSAIGRAFAAEPDVHVVYGQVLLPEELKVRENVEGTTPWLPIDERCRLSRRHGFKVFGMGANVAIRRSMCEAVGGYDEALGVGGPLNSSEDFDFAYRVFVHGGTILLEPQVVVKHYGFRSFADWPATIRGYATGDGAFYLKHVRLGDSYAAQLMVRWFGRMVAREIKRMLRGDPQAGQWEYVWHFLIGMRESFKFGVDRRHRLYYERHQ